MAPMILEMQANYPSAVDLVDVIISDPAKWEYWKWQNSNDAGECWWCHTNGCWNYSRVASTCSGVMLLSTSNRLCCSLKYSKAWNVMVAQPNLVRQSQIWRWFESERCWPWQQRKHAKSCCADLRKLFISIQDHHKRCLHKTNLNSLCQLFIWNEAR